MNRTPPTPVLRALRKEVGFGCPVESCGRPYLTWHHFDPPWNVEQHHRPQGMIALCREHHDKADAGAYTVEQLRKMNDITRTGEVRGRFDWLRGDLFVVGGGLHRNPHGSLLHYGKSCIWFSRDDEGHVLTNISLRRFYPGYLFEVSENYWISDNGVLDIDCPPSGRRLTIHGNNSDFISMEYFEIGTREAFLTKFPSMHSILNRATNKNRISFPMSVMQFNLSIEDGDLVVNDNELKLPNGNGVSGLLNLGYGGYVVDFS